MPADIEHPVVKPCQPSDRNMKIWRYMDLTKLVAFLETRSLHFARADTLGDPLEGSWTRLNRAAREQQIREMIADAKMNTPDAEVHQTPEELEQIFQDSTKLMRKTTYINCWHSGETESAAMWKLYGAATGSIVIQSTYGKLVDALCEKVYMDHVCVGSVYVGLVQYKDYNNLENWIPGGNVMYPFIYKRKEFEHEKEVRAFIWTMEGLSKERQESGNYIPLGIKVDIDIENFVESIRIQPATSVWARQAIERLIYKYGWGMKVMTSQIDIEPMY